MKCPAIVTIIDFDENEFKCTNAYYFGNGRIVCYNRDRKLVLDPECYHPKDAKRLYSADGWTEFRVKSVLLQVKRA